MPVKLEVGKTFRTAFGNEYPITGKIGDLYNNGSHQWTEDGTFLSCYEGGNAYYDLVEEVIKAGHEDGFDRAGLDHFKMVASCANVQDQNPVDFADYQHAANIILQLQKQIDDMTTEMNGLKRAT